MSAMIDSKLQQLTSQKKQFRLGSDCWYEENHFKTNTNAADNLHESIAPEPDHLDCVPVNASPRTKTAFTVRSQSSGVTQERKNLKNSNRRSNKRDDKENNIIRGE